MNEVFTTEEVLKELGGKRIVVFMACFMTCARFEMQINCYPEDFEYEGNVLVLTRPHDKQLVLSKNTKFKKDYLGNFIASDDSHSKQTNSPYIAISLDK